MDFLFETFGEAVDFLSDSSGELGAVVGLTLLVAGIATVVAVALGVPLGITLGLTPSMSASSFGYPIDDLLLQR